MAKLSISTCLTVLSYMIFHLKMLHAVSSYSFSFGSFDKDPNFESSIALYGDAKVVGNSSSLQLTRPVSLSAGRVMYKQPIKLVEGNPGNLVSFSTYFSFLMSPDNGDGLAFVVVPSGFNASVFGNSPFGLYLGSEKSSPKFVAVEFDTMRDAKFGDLNDNHVGIDVGGFVSVKVRNVSSNNMVLNSGKRLHSWIDYEAGSKRLEVRLSHSGDIKPIDPLLSHPIDLSKMWNGEKVLIGLTSSNGNSSQTCFLHSWNFTLRRVPLWMHSQPLDPQDFAKHEKPVVVQKKSNCILKMLTAMIFGTACGALGAFMVLYLWTIFGNRRPVMPEECSVPPVDFEYKKVKVIVDKAIEDGKH
ncbi:PREDICTED: lectin-like protein At1g53070 [Populus euphratica]|uniref:Lectin-like protein At1g53070 n=1 Tax=Populus euphratica TaxID=75702 RepID=A0AAJ6TWY9_POPEU|nr:PREDICTED: lectin-like protein At1g53070 [Populus euphratica]